MRLSLARLVATTFVALSLLASSRAAEAQPMLLNSFTGPLGYGTQCLSPNDDGSSNPVDLSAAFPTGLNFYGTVYHQAWVNTNGNISFSGPLSTFTPNAFPGAPQPVIAPYWADVDIRPPTAMCGNVTGSCGGYGSSTSSPGNAGCMNPTTNGVWWYVDPGPPGRFIVTWDHVGYFYCSTDKVMNFQMILTAATACGSSTDTTNFDVEFRYNRCQWEDGHASGGTCGFGGTAAVAGFDAHNMTASHPDDFVMIPGSRMMGISGTLCGMSNVGTPGIWDFQVRGGMVMCPTAGQPCMTGMPGICAQGAIQCTESGMTSTTTCVPLTGPQPMQCNGLDNNCDGMIDNGPCPAGDVCDGAQCVPMCIEGACFPGQTCSAAGLCEETACLGVSCPAGQRCMNGMCVDPCGGVTCPQGQICRLGACVDACSGLNCGTGQVCENGMCVQTCPCRPCASGQTCTADGHCVDSACASMMCAAGMVCMAGNCVDACTGVTCPMGQTCTGGQCVAQMSGSDAGVDAGMDGSTTRTDSGADGSHNGSSDGRAEGGSADGSSTSDGGHGDGGRGTANPGCACRAGTTRSGATGSFALAVVALAAIRRRRRRAKR